LGDAQPDFVLQDVARYCLELSILSADPLLAFRRAFFFELREAFLDAYGLDERQRSMDLITVNIALALLLTAAPALATASSRPRWHRHVAHFLIDCLSHPSSERFCL
jgi:hypothetical protein